jgi:predicted amidohydrolase
MPCPIHVAIGSTLSRPGQVDANLAEIAGFAAQAGRDGADLLLTPELSACGYGPYPEVLATAEVAGAGPVYRALADLARTHRLTVCAGFVEQDGGRRLLAHYAVHADGTWTVQRKHRVTLAERPLEPAWPLIPPDYNAGPPADPMDPGQPAELRFSFFTVAGVRCGIAICADGGIPGLHRHFAEHGARLILGPAGAGGLRCQRVTTADLRTPAGRRRYQEVLAQVFFPGDRIADCLASGVAMAAVNQCGYDGRNLYHVGHGMIVSAMGEVPALIHGLPNLDRQRPMYAHAVIDVEDRLTP